MKRSIGIASITLAVFFVVTSTAWARHPTTRPEVTLHFEAWLGANHDGAATAVTTILGNFEKSHPTIKVDFTPLQGDVESDLETAFLSHAGPDVFEVDLGWYRDVIKVMQREDSYAVRDKSFGYEKFAAGLVGGFTTRRKVYVYPTGYSTLGVYFNRSLLKGAQSKYPPGNTSSFSQLVCKMTNKTTHVYGVSLAADALHWFAFLGAFGGHVLNGKATTSAIVSKPSVAALAWYANMVNHGCAEIPGSGSSNVQEFAEGHAAMTVESSTLIPYLRSLSPPHLLWGVAPLPAGPRGISNVADATGFALSAHTTHRTAAWDLIAYLDSPSAMSQFDAATGYLPSRTNVQPPKYMSEFAKGYHYAKIWTWPAGLQVNAFPHIGDDIKNATDGQMTYRAAVDDMGVWLKSYL